MKNVFLLLLACVASQNLFAQDSPPSKTKDKPRAGLLLAGNMTRFSRSGGGFQPPAKEPYWQWQAAISVDAINKPHYGLRWELGYNNVGAKEVFSDNATTRIKSQADLSYAQANLFPAVYRPLGRRKVASPYVAVGGYASYLLNAKYNTTVDTAPSFIDDVAKKNTEKIDYGLLVSVGVDIKSLSLEYRVQSGSVGVFTPGTTASTAKNNPHSIVLIIR